MNQFLSSYQAVGMWTDVLLGEIFVLSLIVWFYLAWMFQKKWVEERGPILLSLTLGCYAIFFESAYLSLIKVTEVGIFPQAWYPFLSLPIIALIPRLALVLTPALILVVIREEKKG